MSAWKNVAPSRDELFQLKRTALLREAARAFSARGYHDTSLDDVAKTLGVTKPALYYYVKNKQEILYECHMLALDLGDAAFEYARKHGSNGRERVVLVCQRYIELMTSEIGSFALLCEFAALESENRAKLARRRSSFDARFKELLAEGMDDGSVREIDPRVTVFFFMGAINWMSLWFRPDGDVNGEAMAVKFADLLDHAIMKPAPHHSPASS